MSPRKPKQFTNRHRLRDLKLTENCKDDNFRLTDELLNVFKYNVKYITFNRGYALTQVFDELNRVNISLSRSAFIVGHVRGKRIIPSLLYFVTFANVLDVPLWLLFSLDIESDCKRLGLF